MTPRKKKPVKKPKGGKVFGLDFIVKDQTAEEATNQIEPISTMVLAKTMLNAYIVKEEISDFSLVRIEDKLQILQKTPKNFIEERTIGGQTVQYIKHQYSKSCLNFVFNFRISNDVTKEDYISYEEEYQQRQADKTYKTAIRTVLEAEATVRFRFTWPDGTKDYRTVKSCHKQYKNSAICRGDAMQSAISKSWTKVAATFGIGADLKEDLYPKEKSTTEIYEAEVPANQTALEVPEYTPKKKAFEVDF